MRCTTKGWQDTGIQMMHICRDEDGQIDDWMIYIPSSLCRSSEAFKLNIFSCKWNHYLR